MEILFLCGAMAILIVAMAIYGNKQLQHDETQAEIRRMETDLVARNRIHASEIAALAQIEQQAWAGNVPDAPLSADQQSFQAPMMLMTYTEGAYDPTGIRKFQYDSQMRIIEAWHKAHPEAGGK